MRRSFGVLAGAIKSIAYDLPTRELLWVAILTVTFPDAGLVLEPGTAALAGSCRLFGG